jgi:mannose-1-phosphate guanylyltransferase / mannose-6-phosphate isomerase
MAHEGVVILPVIMCGGAGTRLWPASRESMPKQFIRLVGERSMFQATASRLAQGASFLKPLIIANVDSRFIVAEQLNELGISANIVLEPVRRDSAAAVAVATVYAERHYPAAVVLVMAADHYIEDQKAFTSACETAALLALEGNIVMLGIEPTNPATSYGYIAKGDPIKETGAHSVHRFIEKPDLEAASRYVRDGYLWNAGYFLFKHEVMRREFGHFAPEILVAATRALDAAIVDLDFVRLDKGAFEKAPKTSIDYAVIEKTEIATVLPTPIVWSDVGSWNSVWGVSEQDIQGNVVRGRVEAVDVKNSLVHSDELLTAVVGLSDVIVVTTPDAVLVASRRSAEAVKDLVLQLRLKRRREADEHLRMYRPWGWYQRIDIGTRFQVKRIMVKPGSRLSLQRHFHRAEHWVVVRGVAEVTLGDQVMVLHENESIGIPIGAVHRLANPGRIPLELIEVQVGAYTGEDDIVRLEDVYGRG